MVASSLCEKEKRVRRNKYVSCKGRNGADSVVVGVLGVL
jgi:hypothetical protein